MLDSDRYQEFVQRWNMFQYKMHEGMQFVSVFDYDSGLSYIRSAIQDVHALIQLKQLATDNLRSYISCAKVCIV